MTKTYIIERHNDGRDLDVTCTVQPETGQSYDLWEHHSVNPGAYHSPTGFEFGYAGSGPAELARAIMFDYYGTEDGYYDFRVDVIQRIAHDSDGAAVKLSGTGWTLTDLNGMVLRAKKTGEPVTVWPANELFIGPIKR